MISSKFDFQQYNSQKSRLVDLISKCEILFKDLGQTTKSSSLNSLKEKLKSNLFKIMVVGEFKRGKSTFINALLGEEILPAFATPTTAVINEIKHGDDKKAVIHFRDPVPKLPNSIPDEARNHIIKARGRKVAPLQISYDELEYYVAIPDPSKGQAESIAETPYSKVELFYPAVWLKNGIELIDSPGLNEHRTREGVTLDYLPSADAILFVLSCSALAGVSEMRVIRNTIIGNGHNEIFFICNRFDEIRSKERERVKNHAYAQLERKTEFGKDGIFFVSALQGLDGKMEGDEALLTKSGLEEFEDKLKQFLVANRGKIKILQPARELSNYLNEANEIVDRERIGLQQSLADLSIRYEEVKPLLEDAEKYTELISTKINSTRLALKQLVADEAYMKLQEIADLMPEWVNEMQADSKIKVFSLGYREDALSLAEEVKGYLTVMIENEFLKWKESELTPLIREKLSTLYEDMEANIEHFYGVLDRISSNFSGIDVDEDSRAIKGASDAERFFTTLGAMLIGDLPLAAHGAKFGVKGFGRALVTQLAIGVSLALLGILNPFILFGAAISGGFLNSYLRAEKMNKQIKIEIGNKFIEKFKASIHEKAQGIGQSVYKETQAIVESSEEILIREINSKREQVESVLSKKKEGEQAVSLRTKILNDTEIQIQQVSKDLKEIIFKMAQV